MSIKFILRKRFQTIWFILVAAWLTGFGGKVELQGAAGDVDQSFGQTPYLLGPVTSISPALDGKVLVAGPLGALGIDKVTRSQKIFLLETNGNINPGFNPKVTESAIHAISVNSQTGRTLAFVSVLQILYQYRIHAFSTSGLLESTLQVNPILNSNRMFLQSDSVVYRQPDGGLLLHPNPQIRDQLLFRYVEGAWLVTRTNLPAWNHQSSGAEIRVVSSGGVTPTYSLVRYAASGLRDPSFTIELGPLFLPPLIRVQPDDRVLVSMAPSYHTPFPPPGYVPPTPRIVRYEPNGEIDASFKPILLESVDYHVAQAITFEFLPDQKLLVGGWFQRVDKATKPFLFRADLGAPAHKPPVFVSVIEDRDLVSGQKVTLSPVLQATGENVFQWYFNGKELAGQTNRTLTLERFTESDEGGYSLGVTNARGSAVSSQTRLTMAIQPAGLPDLEFDPGTGPMGGDIGFLLAEPDGCVLAGGSFTNFGGISAEGLVRLLPNGKPDPMFVAGSAPGSRISPARLVVTALARQDDGLIYVAGIFTPAGGLKTTNLFRLLRDGSVDTNFNANPASVPEALLAILPGPDRTVYLGGTFNYTNKAGIRLGSDGYRNLVRLKSDGSLDTTFNPHVNSNLSWSGVVFSGGTFPGVVRKLALGPDGTIYVAGSFDPPEAGLARLNSDGSIDNRFAPKITPVPASSRVQFPPNIWTAAFSRDGHVAAGGEFMHPTGGAIGGAVVRFDAAGTSYGLEHGFLRSDHTLVLQSDGKLVVGSLFDSFAGELRRNLVRLNRDGSVDLTFGTTNSGPNGLVTSVAEDSFGGLFVAGNFSQIGDVKRAGIARLHKSGNIHREILKPMISDQRFQGEVRSVSGRRQVLETTDRMSGGTWTQIWSEAGDGSIKKLSVPIETNSSRFFRLRVEPVTGP